MDDRATHLIHTCLKGDARARARLLEHHCEGSVVQGAMWLVTFEFVFDKFCAFEDVQNFIPRKVAELQKMPQKTSCSGVRHNAPDRFVCRDLAWPLPV